MVLPIGDLVSAGANLIGGLIGQSNTASANAAARRQAAQIAKDERKMAQKNIRLQKDFAQQGIRWKVEDAERAGIHPLYALGAQTSSFSPVSVGSASYSPQADASMPNALANIGQDLSRAIQTTRTQSERDVAYENTARALTLQKMGLENELLGSQIAKLRQTDNPPMPLGLPIGEVGASPRNELWIGGKKWETSEYTSSGTDFQNRYGDEGPIAWFAGVPALAADTWKNFTFFPGGADDWLTRRRAERLIQWP